MTELTHAPGHATVLSRSDLTRQLAAALKRGTSALVLGSAGTSDVLAEVAAGLAGARIRVLRVRPPYNLTSFMQQLAPNGSEEDGSLLDGAYEALAVLNGSCTRIVLLAEDAHLLPKTTLRYIESALRNRPHLSVALAGQPELAAALEQPELSDLRERIALHLALSGAREDTGPAVVVGPLRAANVAARPSRRRAWAMGGVFSLLCAGLIGSQLVAVPWDLPSGLLGRLVPGTAPDPVLPKQAQDIPAAALPLAGAVPAAAPAGSDVVPEPAVAALPSRPATPPVAVASVPGPVVLASPPPASTSLPAPPPLVAEGAPVAAPLAVAPPVATPPSVAPSVAAMPPAAVQPPATAPTVAAATRVETLAPAVIEPPMVALQGGEFRMGGDDVSEKPVRTVVLKPFLVSRTAVTVRAWGRCVEAGVCQSTGGGRPDDPVLNVSWNEARAYVAWLSGATAQPYRLLTEAEWEYAARAGATTRYSWGNAMLPGRMSCKGCGQPVSLQFPPRVDGYPPNAYGLFGMGGGAAEWVADCWHRTYQGAPRDSSVPWDAPDCRIRVLRGGSWMEDAAAQRAAARDSYDASVRYPTHGFRIARSR